LNLEELRDERGRKVKGENLGENEHGAQHVPSEAKHERTFPLSDAFLAISRAQSRPWVRK
jgi:hypothetical protein